MRGKIIYLLAVLLFLTAGAFGRPRGAEQAFDSRANSSLSQRTTPAESGADRYLNHSLLAPESLSEGSVSRPDCKTPVRNLVAPNAHPTAAPKAAASALFAFADLHPDPVGYYVFSLEKIRI